MMTRRRQDGIRAAILALGLSVLVVFGAAGCKTTTPAVKPAAVSEVKKSAEAPLMAQARAARDAGRYNDALLALAQQERVYSGEPGLEDLRTSILDRMLSLREKELKPAIPVHQDKMVQDVKSAALTPDTYGAKRLVTPPATVVRSPAKPAEAMLKWPVSLSLEGADLTVFIMGLTQAASSNRSINIIADDAISGGKKLTMSVTNVPLQEVLEYAARNLDVTFYTGENMIWVTKGSSGKAAFPMETRIFKLAKGLTFLDSFWSGTSGGGKSDSAVAQGGDILAVEKDEEGESVGITKAIKDFIPTVEGSAMMYERNTHSLIVKNTSENIRLIEQLVEALDVTPPQVLIEARFIETELTDLRELGLDWNFNELYINNGGKTRATIRGLNMSTIGPSASTVGPTLTGALGYQGTMSSEMFAVLIKAIEESGKSQTLSVPRVTTLNNQPAKIWQGDELRYYEKYRVESYSISVNGTNTTNSRLVPDGSPTREELGIKLEVMPSIGADHATVSLALKPEISVNTGWEYFGEGSSTSNGVIKLPRINKQQIQTKVTVKSGETVVMGGLIKSTEVHSRRQVPLLGSIPFLGAIFRYDQDNTVQKNLLIFVTARILAETGEELVPVTPTETPLAAK